VTGYFLSMNPISRISVEARGHLVAVRLWLLSLIVCVASTSAAGDSDFVAQHPQVADAIALLDLWIEENRLYHQIPGIAIGIVYEQDLIWAKGYGFSDLESRTPMTPETLLRIGSVTKVFTATAVLQLRDQGKLQLDEPITRHLADFRIQNPFPDAPEITIWHLLTHTSGLPREAAFPYWTDHAFPSREEIVAAAASQTLIYPPGTEYRYSNLGVSLLGAIIEEVSGKSYREVIESQIFSPLQMNRSSVDPPAGETEDLATAYMRRRPDGSRETMDYYEVRGMASMGSIVSSIEDMARFAALHLRQGSSTADGEILRTSTMREMHRPQWVYSSWSGAMGLGFRIAPHNGRNTVSHGGWIGDHRSHLLLVPEIRTGVVAMVNAGDVSPYLFSFEALDLVGDAIAESTKVAPQKSRFDPAWKRYTGLYSDPWGWEYRVLILSDRLVMYSHDYPPGESAEDGLTNLEYVEGDTFKIGEGEYVSFEMTHDGKVERVKRRTDYLFPVQ
jgi:CubicO group peptidase (beta-lactamase class C family)